jgi:thymidine kinase
MASSTVEVEYTRGRIVLIEGPMFAGKSTELARLMRRARIACKNVVLFKYSKDVRDGAGAHTLRTHDKIDYPAVAVTSAADIIAYYEQHSDLQVIGVDEGQFIKGLGHLVEPLALHMGVEVIVSALNLKFDRTPWPETDEVRCFADQVVRLTAVCFECGSEDGVYSHRLGQSKETELIGGAKEYEALCRACYVVKNPGSIGTIPRLQQ